MTEESDERAARRTPLAWLLLPFFLLPALYLAAYLGVRGTHRLVHCSWFISEEGLNAHTDHEIATSCVGTRPITPWPVVFAPLIELELAVQRHRRP